MVLSSLVYLSTASAPPVWSDTTTTGATLVGDWASGRRRGGFRESGFSAVGWPKTRWPKQEIRESSLGLNRLSGQFSEQRPYLLRHFVRPIEVGRVCAG